jgi:nucleoside-diphosphate kinase
LEKTLIILKPDSVRRKLLGEIISRFEKKGFNVENMDFRVLSRTIVEQHYSHVKILHPQIFDSIVDYMTSGPVLIIVLSGNDVIFETRKLIGKTIIKDALPGTIRGDLGISNTNGENLIHASDSPESALEELKRFGFLLL